jgi:hypothetical protein
LDVAAVSAGVKLTLTWAGLQRIHVSSETLGMAMKADPSSMVELLEIDADEPDDEGEGTVVCRWRMPLADGGWAELTLRTPVFVLQALNEIDELTEAPPP